MKKFVLAAVLGACILALPGQAYAAETQEGQKIEFSQSDNEIDVTLTSQVAAGEKISSLQLSLKVESVGDAEIQFSPNGDLPAKIINSRYHEDTGILNIYVAGGDALFDGENYTCRLGSVVIANPDAEVTISVVEDSLKYVRGTELVAQNRDVEYPKAVNYPAGNQNPPGGNENAGGSGSDTGNAGGSGSDTGNSQGNGSTVQGSGSNSQGSGSAVQGSGGNHSLSGSGNRGSGAGKRAEDTETMLDESRLRDVLKRAAEYDAADYTQESYQLLLDAVAKAEELLNMPNVTQEELDEAQLVIENAIGMLELAADEFEEKPEGSRGDLEEGGQETEDFKETSSISVRSIVLIAAVVVLAVILIVDVIVLVKRRIKRRK